MKYSKIFYINLYSRVKQIIAICNHNTVIDRFRKMEQHRNIKILFRFKKNSIDNEYSDRLITLLELKRTYMKV